MSARRREGWKNGGKNVSNLTKGATLQGHGAQNRLWRQKTPPPAACGTGEGVLAVIGKDFPARGGHIALCRFFCAVGVARQPTQKAPGGGGALPRKAWGFSPFSPGLCGTTGRRPPPETGNTTPPADGGASVWLWRVRLPAGAKAPCVFVLDDLWDYAYCHPCAIHRGGVYPVGK